MTNRITRINELLFGSPKNKNKSIQETVLIQDFNLFNGNDGNYMFNVFYVINQIGNEITMEQNLGSVYDKNMKLVFKVINPYTFKPLNIDITQEDVDNINSTKDPDKRASIIKSLYQKDIFKYVTDWLKQSDLVITKTSFTISL